MKLICSKANLLKGVNIVSKAVPTRTTMAIKQREARQRCGANPQKLSQFRLQAATRLHEVGIASNRRSACCGEYVPGPCTHRPSHHGSR